MDNSTKYELVNPNASIIILKKIYINIYQTMFVTEPRV
jgi:hypothetical protein